MIFIFVFILFTKLITLFLIKNLIVFKKLEIYLTIHGLSY
uniref:Uncharacterized protein n=1 Tax=Polysiphonia infestans TaxID=2006978 RepID=A0A1Z1MEG7_9FLOR|nr:hypothetical protein [Polysiphonia infestans]ARW64467.1 hypothetical protein [Polysiphonia infestans]